MNDVANFIYVFSKDERDKLLSLNYKMLKSDETKQVYVFLNKEQQNFSAGDLKFALSNTLTF